MNAILKPYEDGQLVYLSPNEITVVEGFNPRTYFDPTAAEELEASIRAEGIQQNLVVRPDPELPGRYLLIAGERRLRAARKIGLSEVPCLVRHVDERQALAIAALENAKRQNISPAEEAKQAQRVLDVCQGDRDEACRLLGWSRSRLDARLLLLHAHADVLKALAERRIKLGIAELLSTLPKSAQEKNLPIVIEKGYSVAELRAKLEHLAQKLSAAIFDTGDCNGCPHNSSTQASLFDDGLGDGYCMGRSCYSDKTQATLAARKAELETEYNVVFLDIEKPAGSRVAVVAEGASGVGKEQAEACKGCAHFGALLSSTPGEEGRVSAAICFDPLCHAKKVKAHKAATQAPRAAKSAAKTGTGRKSPQRAHSVSPETTPKRVQELAVAFLRQQAAEAITDNAHLRETLALHALLDVVGKAREHGVHLADRIVALHKLDTEARTRLFVAAAQALAGTHTGRSEQERGELERTAIALVRLADQSLTGTFTLTEAFLKAHTKSGIEALMREAVNPQGETFAAWWEAHCGPFKKLMGRKVGEIIDAILKSDFDFSQWVPSCILREADKVKV